MHKGGKKTERTQACTYTHTHTGTHARTHTRTHTHIHTNTQARTHAHAHAHAHVAAALPGTPRAALAAAPGGRGQWQRRQAYGDGSLWDAIFGSARAALAAEPGVPGREFGFGARSASSGASLAWTVSDSTRAPSGAKQTVS